MTTSTNTVDRINVNAEKDSTDMDVAGAVVNTTGTDVWGKIELKDIQEVINNIPPLTVIKDIRAIGIDELTGLEVEHQVDRGYRLAGHIVPDAKTGVDRFHAVPWMKSDGYQATSHQYTLATISENLTRRGLDHGVWKAKLSRNFGVMNTRILLSKPYQINEDPFENAMMVQKYNDHQIDTTKKGQYQPCIHIVNSFYGASTVEFSLIRIICLNGMSQIADKLKLGFVHLGKEAVLDFEQKSDRFLENIFSKNVVEQFMLELQEQPVMLQYFLEYLMHYAGPRAAENAMGQFGLDTHSLDEKINAWVAYNIMTFVASNIITSSLRQARMFTGWGQFRNSNFAQMPHVEHLDYQPHVVENAAPLQIEGPQSDIIIEG